MPIERIDVTKELEAEAEQRLKDSKAQKDFKRPDIQEAYWFSAPDRFRSTRDSAGQKPTPTNDAADRWTSLAEECCQDFITEIWSAFFVDDWAKLRTGTAIPEDVARQVEADINAQTAVVHREIRASNFESAFAQAGVPDAGIGTMALWIEDARPGESIVCHPVPIRELEINLGPFGGVDDRWVVRQVQNRHLKAVLRGVPLPNDVEAKIKSKPDDRTEVRRGFWRDWADTGNIAWREVIMVGKKVVMAQRRVGAGTCPLIVMRFNPDPSFAFGNGPMLQKLPEFRTYDELTGLSLENAEMGVRPPFAYHSDTMLNFENGIMAGTGYPSEVPVKDAFEKLWFEGDVNLGLIEEEKLVRSIRRAFFIDRPEQTGDTPPTATQWLDEMALAQRRLAVPAASFWSEGPKEIFLRFHRILMDRGTIQPIEAGGRTFTVDPYNPTERAKDMQEVQVAERLIMIINSAFPQVGQLMMDGPKTIANIQEKLGDSIVALQDPAQVTELLNQFAQGMAAGEFNNLSRN